MLTGKLLRKIVRVALSSDFDPNGDMLQLGSWASQERDDSIVDTSQLGDTSAPSAIPTVVSALSIHTGRSSRDSYANQHNPPSECHIR
jgi:hypothetical protein